MKRAGLALTGLLALALAACGQGAPGPKGDRGEKGEKGAKGEPGETGAAAIRIEQKEGCGNACRVSCRPDEVILTAYCYRQGGVAAPSAVAYQIPPAAPASAMTASCIAGGLNIRAFCIKSP